MSRAAVVALLIAIPILVAADDDTAQKQKATAKQPPPSIADRQKHLVQLLNKPVTFDRSFDGVPLQDVLEFVADRHDISIMINESAFRAVMDVKASEQLVRIPKMTMPRLRTFLEFALEQIGATFLVKGDQLEVVPKSRAIR